MNGQSLFPDPPQGMTLSALNARIENAISRSTDLHNQWVIAEAVDMRLVKGHCYMELIEKDPSGNTIAKISAAIWASNYGSLYYKFKNATGQPFGNGMKLLLKVTATYHRLFGFKLVINDINPEFTLGDLARQRQEIINRLTAEGIIDMNKQLPWTEVPQRIAIISAAGAAGYGDFMNQLHSNAYGLKYYTCLFSASMQGAQTVPTVLAALDRINASIDLFDCVVIIRGGGATSELNSFDNYDLASAVAQFPISVIVGIGHERDVTVLDFVAAMRVKTPTAAAEWLIQRGTDALAHLNDLQDEIATTVRETIAHAREQLAYYGTMIPATARSILDTNRVKLDSCARALPVAAVNLITAQRSRLERAVERMGDAVANTLLREKQRLQSLDEKATLLSPLNTLRRGYSLVMKEGKCITAATQLKPGDLVTVQFATGKADATIDNVNNQQQ